MLQSVSKTLTLSQALESNIVLEKYGVTKFMLNKPDGIVFTTNYIFDTLYTLEKYFTKKSLFQLFVGWCWEKSKQNSRTRLTNESPSQQGSRWMLYCFDITFGYLFVTSTADNLNFVENGSRLCSWEQFRFKVWKLIFFVK